MRYIQAPLVAGLILLASSGRPAEAQTADADAPRHLMSVEVRGSYDVPISDFGDSAESDWGFGAGGVASLSRSFGVYGGWAKDSFGCAAFLCSEESRIHVSGFELGARIGIPIAYGTLPWVKAGVIGHTVKFEGDIAEFESERHFGFQVAAGLDIPLGQVISVVPAVRLNVLEVDDEDFFESPAVRYLAIDVGTHIHFPSN